MAYLNPSLRFRPFSAEGEPRRFQRGLEKVPLKKVQRRLRLKLPHILLFFGLLAGLFFLLVKSYVFLITWQELDVKQTQLSCPLEHVAQDLEPLLDPSKLGNLLVLDLSRLQHRLEAHPWVKEVRLRKVFPSTLCVDIRPRTPAAVLQTGSSFFLIDREGVVLEKLGRREESLLPLLTDSSQFRAHYQEKLSLAWACLDSISLSLRQSIESLDLSQMDAILLTFKEKPTRLLLGAERFQEKIEFFQASLPSLENEIGPLEYVDLRFDDRVYIKPLPVLGQAIRPAPGEEVN